MTCNCYNCRELRLRSELEAMTDEQVQRYFACSICNKLDAEYYMVRNEVWFSADVLHDGFSCIGCLEKALKRKLKINDFSDARINKPLFDAFNTGKIDKSLKTRPEATAKFGLVLRKRFFKSKSRIKR